MTRPDKISRSFSPTTGSVQLSRSSVSNIYKGAVRTVNILPFLGNSLCLLNLGINTNKILRLGKNLQNWENTGLFGLGSSLYSAVK